jgi:hypothetical protein
MRLVGAVMDRAVQALARRQRLDALTDPATKAALRALWLGFADQARRGGPLSATDVGLRVFSQFDEDGITLFLLAVLGAGPRLFLDIGGGDGVHASNCANLALNFGFHGVFIDADAERAARGREFYARHPDTTLYPPVFRHAAVTPDTVNEVVAQAGLEGEISFLSIDIDGNDYWVWEALTIVTPRVVVVESHPELGSRPIVAPYTVDPLHVPGRPPYFLGASPAAMTALARRKGLRLVAANRFGFNLFFVAHSLSGADRLPEMTVDELFKHPRARERLLPNDRLRGLPFVEVD